jgi:hypothetical protein
MLVKEGVDQPSVLLLSVREPGGDTAAATAEKRRDVEGGLGHAGLLPEKRNRWPGGMPRAIP